MRKNIALIQRNEIDQFTIFEEEFMRVKIQMQEDFDEQSRRDRDELQELRQENENNSEGLNEKEARIDDLTDLVNRLTEKMEMIREENEKVHELKSKIERSYIEDVKYLNDELEAMQTTIKDKDEQIFMAQ